MNFRPTRIILSCEYASRIVPPEYVDFFRDADVALQSHGSWDIGAHEMAEGLAEWSGSWLLSGGTTRLLVDHNRRGNDQRLWSEFTRELPRVTRNRIRRVYHYPYRRALLRKMRQHIAAGEDVLHLRIRTFTPAINGRRRRCDVGICHDPNFTREEEAAEALQGWLSVAVPNLIVEINSPAELAVPGIDAWLRENCPRDRYTGIVLGFNQDLYTRRRQTWRELQEIIGFYLEVFASGCPNEESPIPPNRLTKTT